MSRCSLPCLRGWKTEPEKTAEIDCRPCVDRHFDIMSRVLFVSWSQFLFFSWTKKNSNSWPRTMSNISKDHDSYPMSVLLFDPRRRYMKWTEKNSLVCEVVNEFHMKKVLYMKSLYFVFLQDNSWNDRLPSPNDRSTKLEGVVRRCGFYASPSCYHDPVFLVYPAALSETFNVLVY